MAIRESRPRERGARLSPLKGLDPPADRHAVALLIDGGAALALADGARVVVYDIGSGAVARRRAAHELDARAVAIADLGGGRLVVASNDRASRGRLDVVDGGVAELAELEGPVSDVEAVGDHVVAAVRETSAQPAALVTLDAASGRRLQSRPLPPGGAHVTAAGRGDAVLVAHGWEGRVSRVPIGPGRDTKPTKPERPCGSEADQPKDEPPRDRHPDDDRPGQTGAGDDCHDYVADGHYVAKLPRCTDEPPCKNRLDFRAARLLLAKRHLVALDAEGRRLALLDRKTLRTHEIRSLGRGGALVAAAADSDRLVAFRWRAGEWGLLDLGDVLDNLPPLELDPAGQPAESITFHGHNPDGFPPPGDPQLGPRHVLCVTATEPGQDFTDPDLSDLAAFMRPNSFDTVSDFYDENSFGGMDLGFDFFGLDVGPAGEIPIVLPRAIRSYFNPPFVPGGILAEEVAPGTPYEVRLDGTESLTLHVDPVQRPTDDLAVPFCVLGLSESYDDFPVQLAFAGTEGADLEVEDRGGTVWNLALQFPAQTIDIEQADAASGLDDLRTYLDSVLQDAQANAGVPAGDLLFAGVEVRRVRQDGLGFGSLEVNLRLDPGTGASQGRVEVTSQTGLSLIGMNDADPGLFSLPGDMPKLGGYLARALRQAEADAGYTFANRVLSNPTSTWDPPTTTLTTEIRLSDTDGGEGASMTVAAESGLGALGLDAASDVPGVSSKNGQNALRDSQEMVNDVFTGIVDQLGGAVPAGFFDPYFSILICFVGAPPAGEWGATEPDFAGLRMFTRNPTATYANDASIQLDRRWTGTKLDAAPDTATTAHELGHGLLLPDLYSAAGYRDDLQYLGGWSVMDSHGNLPHFCGWSKLFLGFIPPARVVPVGLPNPAGPTTTDALLVPIEYWDADMEADAQAEFGTAIDVGQLMSIDLGGDGVQFDLVEARQQGLQFSQALPDGPGLLVTNALDASDDKRYGEASDEGVSLYRRKVHLLNTGHDLETAGDEFDLAAAPELAAVGVTVRVVDVREVTRPGGSVKVFHTRVEREQADYVDLFFSDATPRWKCPDIWVDFAGDNASDDPDDHHVYPEGTPDDQGEVVRFPASGVELHWVVARVHNKGTASALNVKINARKWDPPGAGDTGKKALFGSGTTDEIPAGDFRTVAIRWDVGPNDGAHQCMQCEIADWELPEDPTAAIALASDDVWLSNNWGQKNVFSFVAVGASPYEPVPFDYSVTNEGVAPELAYLKPEGLPPGMKLTVTPRERTIAAGETAIFSCLLELDDAVIDSGCRNDREFILWTWRETEHAFERWGGCKYVVRPRKPTDTELGAWWSTDDTIHARGRVSPDPGGGHVELSVAFDGKPATWIDVALQPSGSFTWQGKTGDHEKGELRARYPGSNVYAPSYSPVVQVQRPQPPA